MLFRSVSTVVAAVTITTAIIPPAPSAIIPLIITSMIKTILEAPVLAGSSRSRGQLIPGG